MAVAAMYTGYYVALEPVAGKLKSLVPSLICPPL
jgi:hypothetical protein